MYTPPVDDMQFFFEHLLGHEKLAEFSPEDMELSPDLLEAVLGEAAKLASETIAPINHKGDVAGSGYDDGTVTAAPGFKEAYNPYTEGGWNGLVFDPDYGGQGLPWSVAFAVQEMWQGANLSFGLCPLLNQGAVEALQAHGSDEQKTQYLPKLISGEWTGTMNLTEPQAGTDLAAIRSKAESAEDGTYKISGQKIFITWGEHDLTENIIHLVLARLPNAPEGVRGISLFLVPKFIPNEDGSLGKRNDLKCVSIEHKLGINASPTCTMSFGDNGGATGYLIGEENQGLKYMFTMMNNARLSVGLQGVAVAEAACQMAEAYAAERVQGFAIGDKETRVTIDQHPDVQRMLLQMKAMTQIGRALTYDAAVSLDMAARGDEKAQRKVDLLTPVVKASCTDMSVEVTSLGVQVFGGMGFIEETGAAQLYRDARILPIYEGTNGIQAADLLFRKILRDQGAAFKEYIEEVNAALAESPSDALEKARDALIECTEDLGKKAATGALNDIAFVSVPYLQLFSLVAGGTMMARILAKADPERHADKIKTARFYERFILSQASGMREAIIGAD